MMNISPSSIGRLQREMAAGGVFKLNGALFSQYNAQTLRRAISVAPFSTAFERAEGSNNVARGSRDGSVKQATAGTTGAPDPTRQEMNEAKQEAFDVDDGRASGVTGFAAEKLRDGAEMAKDVTDRVGETAKKTIDGTWKAGVGAMEQMKEAFTGSDEEKGPNHNMDFRHEKESTVDDLRRRAGGYDDK